MPLHNWRRSSLYGWRAQLSLDLEACGESRLPSIVVLLVSTHLFSQPPPPRPTRTFLSQFPEGHFSAQPGLN